jgi:hypothetical protein
MALSKQLFKIRLRFIIPAILTAITVLTYSTAEAISPPNDNNNEKINTSPENYPMVLILSEREIQQNSNLLPPDLNSTVNIPESPESVNPSLPPAPEGYINDTITNRFSDDFSNNPETPIINDNRDTKNTITPAATNKPGRGGVGTLAPTHTITPTPAPNPAPPISPLPTPEPTPTPTPDPTPKPDVLEGMGLHRVGNQLLNVSGESITLRGVNYPDWADQAGGLWIGQGEILWQKNSTYRSSAVADNLNMMASWGCNVVRLHLAIEYWLNNTSNFRSNLKDMISLARERGIYVIIEFYSNMGWPNEQHFPLPYGNYIPDGIFRTQMPNLQAFVNLWANIAAELKSCDNLIIEPYTEANGDNSTKSEYFAMMQDIIEVIRANGANQPIVVQWDYMAYCNVQYHDKPQSGNLSWVYDYPLSDPQDNLIISTHCYANSISIGNGSVYVGDIYENILVYTNRCLIDKVSQEYPLIIGEIGATNGVTQEIISMENCLRRFNELGIGYLGFSWSTRLSIGLLTGQTWMPSPNQQGEILINAIANSKQ